MVSICLLLNATDVFGEVSSEFQELHKSSITRVNQILEQSFMDESVWHEQQKQIFDLQDVKVGMGRHHQTAKGSITLLEDIASVE